MEQDLFVQMVFTIFQEDVELVEQIKFIAKLPEVVFVLMELL